MFAKASPMSAFPPPRTPCHVSKCHQFYPPLRIYCSTTTTITPTPRQPEPLVAESPQVLNPGNPITSTALQNDPSLKSAWSSQVLNPGRPITLTALLNDPSLKSTWSQRVWVASGCTTVLVSLARSITGAADSHVWLEPILAGLIGYVLADLGSGVYHWGIDNYGSEKTPVCFGSSSDLHSSSSGPCPQRSSASCFRWRVLRLHYVQPTVPCMGSWHKKQAPPTRVSLVQSCNILGKIKRRQDSLSKHYDIR